MSRQNYWRLGTGLGIFVIAIFVMGFMVSASCSNCEYSEFYKSGSFSPRYGDDIEIETDGSRLLKYVVYREQATGILEYQKPTTYTCKYLDDNDYDSRWRSGTLCPRDDVEYSPSTGYCYYVEYEGYDCTECESGDDDCDDYEYLECIDGEWENQGEVMDECDVECFGGEDKCKQYDFYICDDFEWDKEGKVAGECGVDCVSDSDCSGNDICENYVCEQNPCDYLDCDGKCESGKLYNDGTCNYATGACVYDSPSTCEFGCDGNYCADDPCEGVTCEDKCSGNTKYNMGYCSGGQCVYDTNTCEFGCSSGLCKQNPCLGVDTSDRCEDGRWKHDGRCDNGNVFYDAIDNCVYGCQGEPAPILAAIIGGDWCRDSPCQGVTCDDYCSGTTKMTDGVCNSGKCVYSGEVEYNKDCGHVPFYKSQSFLIGVGIFVFLFILISGLIIRGKKKS